MAIARTNNAKVFVDEVAINGILKEQVAKEELASSVWNTKWGFMKNLDKMCIDIAKSMGISEERYRRTRMRPKGEFNGDVRASDFVPTIIPSDPIPETSAAATSTSSERALFANSAAHNIAIAMFNVRNTDTGILKP
ncbi:uncharacterized protein LOC116174555 [Photinus pyralis]|uniref:uncharacterized protein LOC116174555 n=1 Tax=Photinus pyralis TaxID=7054 RepID=UPI0012672A5A|nr:uncharacterized protein LOC116174555 [Photinus pyralis]